MIILPAIDLKDGKVVRLRQGKAEDMTVYGDDPVKQALEFQEQGATYLHIVDLDGAFSGDSKNFEAIRRICSAVKIPCEMGGGIRTLEKIEAVLEAGISRAIIGTAACQDPTLIEKASTRFGRAKIAVGIDARDGKVAVKGWTETSQWSPLDLARVSEKAGAGTIIYTDISTDGMLEGPNLKAMQEMSETVKCQIIASGGVGTKADVEALAKVRNLYGVIVGKALYDGRVTLPELIEATQVTNR